MGRDGASLGKTACEVRIIQDIRALLFLLSHQLLMPDRGMFIIWDSKYHNSTSRVSYVSFLS